MPRKRKVARPETVSEQSEKEFPKKKQHPIYVIVQNAQINEAFHVKYFKELQNIYINIGHDEFMKHLITTLKHFMQKSSDNTYANIGLRFLAKFVASFSEKNDSHPILVDTFGWTLNTLSLNNTARFRLCEFINLILNSFGPDAALDDTICDKIFKYMLDGLKDSSQFVRVQAVHALQRLQIPDSLNDPVVKAYHFHLTSDPSTNVRQAVISSIGRNFQTIPIIIERFWDIDEKVRRHAYLQMCSYPVKAYKVMQRLTFLEQGLTDTSDKVKKIVCNVLLPQWFESYNKDFIAFISSLKLDSNTTEMDRFRKAAKMAIVELFKNQKDNDLIDALELVEEGEFKTCIPLDKLTIESTLLWSSLIEYFEESDDKCERADLIMPDLSAFCNFILKYCKSIVKDGVEKWKIINYQYILRTLTDILLKFDLGDEIGRQNLRQCFIYLLSNEDIEEITLQNIVQCAETLIPLTTDRMQFFCDIINDIVNMDSDIDLCNETITNALDKDQELKVKVTSVKFKIMELREQKSELIQRNEYEKIAKISEELNVCHEQIIKLIKASIYNSDQMGSVTSISTLINVKIVTDEQIIRCLQMAFFAVCSKVVQSLTPNMAKLYKDFIRPQIGSTHWQIRHWAIKCSASFSLLYSHLAKDTYKELYAQFFKNQNSKIWATAITASFQLIDRYGFTFFTDNETDPNKSKSKKTRQLFNVMEYVDADEDTILGTESGIDIMHLFDHFLDTCVDVNIISALIDGFCRLILRGHYVSKDMVSKLLLKYFNPMTDPLTNQILGIFLETLMKSRKQECLQPALLPTLFVIMDAPNESPLKEVKPQTVLRFVINSTIPSCSSPGLNIHNTMAMSFLKAMIENPNNKDLLRLLSSMFNLLDISDDTSLRNDIKADFEKLESLISDPKVLENIKKFKASLDNKSTNTFSSSAEIISRNPECQNEIFSNEHDEDNPDPDEQNECCEDENVSDIDVNDKSQNIDNNLDVLNESVESHIVPSTVIVNQAQIHNSDTIENPNSDNSSITSTTPTTYGLENSTKARNLRKSLHFRQKNGDIEMHSPAKIRAVNKDKIDNKKVNQSQLVNNVELFAKKKQPKEKFTRRNSNIVEEIEEDSGNENDKTKNNSVLSLNNVSTDSETSLNAIIPKTPEPPTRRSKISRNLTERFSSPSNLTKKTLPEKIVLESKTIDEPANARKTRKEKPISSGDKNKLKNNQNISETKRKLRNKSLHELSSSENPQTSTQKRRTSRRKSTADLKTKTISNDNQQDPANVEKRNAKENTAKISFTNKTIPQNELHSRSKKSKLPLNKHSDEGRKTEKRKEIEKIQKGFIRKTKKTNPLVILEKMPEKSLRKYATRKATIENILQNTIVTRRTVSVDSPIGNNLNKTRRESQPLTKSTRISKRLQIRQSQPLSTDIQSPKTPASSTKGIQQNRSGRIKQKSVNLVEKANSSSALRTLPLSKHHRKTPASEPYKTRNLLNKFNDNKKTLSNNEVVIKRTSLRNLTSQSPKIILVADKERPLRKKKI